MHFIIVLVSISLCLFTLFSLLIAYHIFNHRQLLQLQLTGLDYTRILTHVLAKTQQHRGMTTAQLKGDQSFKHDIQRLQLDIKDSYLNLAKKVHPEKKYHQQLQQLNTDWQQLQNQSHTLTVTENYQQHCNFINRLLEFIEIIASHHQLNYCTAFSARQIDMVWRILPATAEAIGQARAIGSGIAASGKSSAIDKIKIGFLNSKIQSALETTVANFKDQKNLPENFKDDIHHIKVDADLLVNNMQKNFIETDTPSISSHDFFEEATLLLNNIFVVYGEAEDRLQQQTKKEINQTQSRLHLSYSSAAILMISFCVSLILP